MAILIQKTPELTKVGKVNNTPSTLTIPFYLIGYFNIRVNCQGGLRKYFQHLLLNYARNIKTLEAIPDAVKWKNQYQDPHQALQRWSFKPEPVEWEEFR